MFSFFKKKNPIDILEKKYKSLLQEAHQLSTSNRSLSDAKVAEAETVAKEIEELKKL